MVIRFIYSQRKNDSLREKRELMFFLTLFRSVQATEYCIVINELIKTLKCM